MLTAITRGVSPSINRCELGYLPRRPIDVGEAERQHHAYEECLRELGVNVISLPAEPDLPDSMFVEDPAVVVDEVAVMTRMGAPSRRPETEALAPVLARYRPLRWMREPATLEGGDVLRIGRAVYVGFSTRTNRDGIGQLAAELRPFGYSVEAVPVTGCLHLKSACCALPDSSILANREWTDRGAFEGKQIVEVPPEEPHAANVLCIGETIIAAACFPRTAELIEGLGFRVLRLDISELMKAEAALTCSSILLEE